MRKNECNFLNVYFSKTKQNTNKNKENIFLILNPIRIDLSSIYFYS